MAVEPQVATAIGVGLVALANVILFWAREYKKHKTWSKNGKHLTEIKKSVETVTGKIEVVDEKVDQTTIKIAEIKTAVNSQKRQCEATVQRFDKTIGEQNQTLIDLASRK